MDSVQTCPFPIAFVGNRALSSEGKNLASDCLKVICDKSRGDRRWTFPNDLTEVGLLGHLFGGVQEFSAEDFYRIALEATL